MSASFLCSAALLAALVQTPDPAAQAPSDIGPPAPVALAAAAQPAWITSTDARTGRAMFMRDAAYAGGYAAGGRRAHEIGRAGLDAAAARLAADAFVARHAGAFGPGDPAALEAYDVQTDALGLTHVRYHQFADVPSVGRVPVFAADLFVHVDADGRVTAASGRLADDTPVGSALRVNAMQALSSALATFSVETGQPVEPGVREPELYVIVPELLDQERAAPALVWQVVVRTIACPDCHTDSEWFYIDAQSGVVRLRLDGERQLNRRILDCSLGMCWYGQQRWYNGQYYQFGRVEGQAPAGPNPVYGGTDTDDVYQWFADCGGYVLATFGRNGCNGLGGTGNGSYVPYTTSQARVYCDTFWFGSCPYNARNTGAELWFCSEGALIDMFGHEYAHGFSGFAHWESGQPVGMIYQSQSGALDENQADLFGKRLETWLVGGQSWLVPSQPNYPGQRNLSDPPSHADAYHGGLPFPDRFHHSGFYCGTLDYSGVHHNSTVPSKAAYLLSAGDLFNGCTIAAIGLDAVEQIWYRAVTTYYTRAETFNQAFLSLQQAAIDLYGAESFEHQQLRRALQAVELDQPSPCAGGLPQVPGCLDQRGDYERDGDVDLADMAGFQVAFSGDGTPAWPPINRAGDFNADDDVDAEDFAAFGAAMTGPLGAP